METKPPQGGEEPDIEYKPSAFKHGKTEADIRWAFTTARYDLPVEGDEDKRLLIGFDYTGQVGKFSKSQGF